MRNHRTLIYIFLFLQRQLNILQNFNILPILLYIYWNKVTYFRSMDLEDKTPQNENRNPIDDFNFLALGKSS